MYVFLETTLPEPEAATSFREKVIVQNLTNRVELLSALFPTKFALTTSNPTSRCQT